MKRLNTLLVLLVTLGMLVVPLASASTTTPAATAQEALNVQPATADTANVVQPAQPIMLAQPAGEGPVLAMDGTGQQAAPALSIAQPVGDGKVMAAQEPLAPAFELVSEARSCEDLTRFDLAWSGTGTIASIDYVLYNSSDNGSTPGTIGGADIAGTSASITGRPGDTTLSLNVTLADGGFYSYVADASECGISSVSIVEQPEATTEPTLVPTTEPLAQPSGETVTIRWGSRTSTVLGAVKASASGDFGGMVTIPVIADRGTFEIHATGASGQTGTATYEVTELVAVKLTLNPASGRAGSVTAVAGSGFRPGETGSIRWGGQGGGR